MTLVVNLFPQGLLQGMKVGMGLSESGGLGLGQWNQETLVRGSQVTVWALGY